MKKIIALSLLFAAATPGVGHEGVKNQAVIERMKNMQVIKDGMGVLGGMAKGAVAFDAAQAEAALASLKAASEQIAPTFEANETDPKSESLPAIWANWDDFVEKADDFSFMLEGTDVSSLDGIRAGMGNIGGTCSACHKQYRMKK